MQADVWRGAGRRGAALQLSARSSGGGRRLHGPASRRRHGSPATASRWSCTWSHWCAVFDRGLPHRYATKLLSRAIRHRRGGFPLLRRAHGPGSLTMLHMGGAVDLADYERRAFERARSVWASWRRTTASSAQSFAASSMWLRGKSGPRQPIAVGERSSHRFRRLHQRTADTIGWPGARTRSVPLGGRRIVPASVCLRSAR